MRADERDAACRLLGAAFADNPSTLANARGDRERARKIIEKASRIAKLGRPFGRVIVADRDGELLGVLNAVRFPHCQLRPLEQVRTAPTLVAALGASLPRVARMAAARARHDPQEEHWHVGPVGVHPDVWGRGVGSALLAAFLEGADADGIAAFLETDVHRNVVLYQRFGFEVLSRHRIQGIDTRFMRRPPAHARTG